MNKKRLRIFAGPNGSGKSTFISNFPASKNLSLGYYINADDIELQLAKTNSLNITSFGISFDTNDIQSYFKHSTFSPVRLDNKDLWRSFIVENNFLFIDDALSINSYIADDIAEFIRQLLLKNNQSFSYETVMSDKKKIEFLKQAKEAGYRIYLYYFSTEDPLINKNRVDVRVLQNGHNVDQDIIEKRYYKSLENLKDAVIVSDRAYLFDSSGQAIKLIAEIENGKEVTVIEPTEIPNWFNKYLVEKASH